MIDNFDCSGHAKAHAADPRRQVGCKRMLTELLAASGITGAIAGAAIVWLLRNWLITRLSAAVKHEYDEKLEKLRVQLQKDRERDVESLKAEFQQVLSAQAAVQSAFAQSHLAAHQKRLDAIADVWKAFFQTRDNLPVVLNLIDVLKPSEYQSFFSQEQVRNLVDELSPQGVSRFSRQKGSETELARPFVGEYLWSLLYAYEAVCIRTVLLLWQYRLKGNGEAWYEDEPTLRIVRAVTTEGEFQDFMQLALGKLFWFRSLVEKKFLAAASRVISGEASTDVAVEQAQRIVAAANDLQQTGDRPNITFIR